MREIREVLATAADSVAAGSGTRRALNQSGGTNQPNRAFTRGKNGTRKTSFLTARRRARRRQYAFQYAVFSGDVAP